MKIIVANIDWDCDDEPCSEELPTQVVIEDPMLMPMLMNDIEDDADNLAVYLTDKYGYCVRGFTTEVEGVGEK